MIYPPDFEKKIGFDSIRKMLADECQSPVALMMVEEIAFSSDHEGIKARLEETAEMLQILRAESGFPVPRYSDLTADIARLRVAGAYMEPETMQNFKAAVSYIHDILRFFNKPSASKYPRLRVISSQVDIDPGLLTRVDALIDDKGRVRDNASPKLAELRRELIIRRWDIDTRVEKIMKEVKRSGWAEEGLDATVRGGRMVIPVLASHKRRLKGLIHDESATGHTVFIEPEEIFEANNEIRELELAERREVIHILQEFADYLRPQIDGLLHAFGYLGLVEFLHAKAKFAFRTESVKPRLSGKPLLNWRKAKHPLLFISHQAQKKPVIPMDISLDEEIRILIISGPNAGGKSVCLKTTGLLQYMLQCGLLVPMAEDSEAGIFEKILIDIGDEQSLENDLSTYSSHLLNMSRFMQECGPDSLFLIDEFGTGTEPQSGGAIAEAILEELNHKKAFGVITTHYANLKIMAGRGNGIANGAMLFDQERMEPLYKLETGKPGSSFAFEIAKKSGMREDILSKAADKVGRKQLDFDRQLQDLESEKKELEKKLQGFSVADTILQETIEKYERLTAELLEARKEILSRARNEAQRILNESNKVIEKTIREIRESQAEKEKTRQLRTGLEEQKEEMIQSLEKEQESPLIPPKPLHIKTKISKPALIPDSANQHANPHPFTQPQPHAHSNQHLHTLPPAPAPAPEPEIPDITDPGPIEKGTWVKMSGQHGTGKVESIHGKQAVVVFGSVRIKCNPDKLQKASRRDIAEATKKEPSGIYSDYLKDINQRAAQFSTTLDLRGRRAEEAMNELQKFVDEAVLLTIFEVRILHGKGDGILRDMVRKALASNSDVRSFRDEPEELGGTGITVVTLK